VPGQETHQVEGAAGALDQLDILTQLPDFSGKAIVEKRVGQAFEPSGVAAFLFAGSEVQESVVEQVIDAAEGLAHAHRPSNRRAFDRQYALDFLQQVEGLAYFPIKLVDEGNDRRVAHTAHVEQLDRLCLDALGRVDHHDCGIDRGQHAVGVFGKVLVAGCIEQVDGMPVILELHDRTGDRDAALLFHFHPVRGRVAGALAPLHGARQLNRSAEKQQLFGECRLAGVGV